MDFKLQIYTAAAQAPTTTAIMPNSTLVERGLLSPLGTYTPTSKAIAGKLVWHNATVNVPPGLYVLKMIPENVFTEEVTKDIQVCTRLYLESVQMKGSGHEWLGSNVPLRT